jgi:uncharacterized membrane protein YphA (DoxX/SURF4 family)
LLGLEMLLFVLFIHIFLIFRVPGEDWGGSPDFGDFGGRLINGFKELGIGGALFIYAGTESKAWRYFGKDKLYTFGRLIFGMDMFAYGLLHFIYPAFAPGLPPTHEDISFFIPGRLFWVCITGAACLVGGLCIFAGKQIRLASIGLAGMILLFDLLTWLPRFPAHPGDILGGWLKDIGIAGGAMILASSAPKIQGP